MNDISKKIDELQKELKLLQAELQYVYTADENCTIEVFLNIFKALGTTFILNESQYLKLDEKTKKLFQLR